jgi:FkbM family methyltransferase
MWSFSEHKFRTTWHLRRVWRHIAVSGALLLLAMCLVPDVWVPTTGALSFSRLGELKAAAWHRPAVLQHMVLLHSALLKDGIKRMVDLEDTPDSDMMLVQPNAHLQSTFHVANPNHPNGIVQYVSEHGGEKAVTEVFHHVLRKIRCGTQDDAGVVLDIGANTGFYSMLALSEGCQRVLLFDPQPTCVRHIAHALVKNGFEDRAAIVPHFVDVRAGRPVELDLSGNCEGRWPIGQLEDPKFKPKASKVITTVAISDVIPTTTRIAHAKVDTEGAEYYVLQSLIPYIKDGLVDSVIFEMTPMWWVHYGLDDRAMVIDQFVRLVTEYGMHCRALDAAPWRQNKVFTKINAAGLTRKIDETYQTDFWFFKPGMDAHADS